MKRASILTCLVLIGCITGATNAQSSHEEILTLLQDNRFSKALDQIESLPKNDSPKLCYWRAVCLAADGQTDLAITRCQELITRWSDAEPTKDASQLIEILENLDANADDVADLYFDAMEQFRQNDGVLQFDCSLPDESLFEFRFAIDFQNKLCELQLTIDGTTSLQFQGSEQGSRWYQSGSNQILELKESFFPVLNFLIEELPDDSFKINISGAFSSRATAAESTWNDLLQRPWFSTRQGCRQFFVDRSCDHATFPTKVTETDGVMVGNFVQPDFKNGGFRDTSCEFDGTGVFSKHPGINMRLQVKPATTATMLEDFQWPDVEMVQQPLDAPFVKQFVQSLMEFFSKKESPRSDY